MVKCEYVAEVGMQVEGNLGHEQDQIRFALLRLNPQFCFAGRVRMLGGALFDETIETTVHDNELGQ